MLESVQDRGTYLEKQLQTSPCKENTGRTAKKVTNSLGKQEGR